MKRARHPYRDETTKEYLESEFPNLGPFEEPAPHKSTKPNLLLYLAAAVITACLIVNIVRGVTTGDWNL